MKTINDPRHKARMRLIETLYAHLLNPDSLDLNTENSTFDKDLYKKILNCIKGNDQAIDDLITTVTDRKISDIKHMEYAIIKVALAEGYFEKITPFKVAIDEALELAREYSDENSVTFVSGVLGGVFSKARKL